MNRKCCRVACSRQAVVTLTFDYDDRLAAIGPLAVEMEPHTYDLCTLHSARLKAPEGWTVLRPSPLGFDT